MSDSNVQQTVVHPNWKQWINIEEEQRLDVIEVRENYKKQSLAELRKERRQIMLRAIRRMRRAEGKD